MARLTCKLLDQKIEDLRIIVIKQGIDLLKSTLRKPDRQHRRNIKYKRK